MDNKIILFQEKQVRREWHNEEWYFSIIDVIEMPYTKNLLVKAESKNQEGKPVEPRLGSTENDGC